MITYCSICDEQFNSSNDEIICPGCYLDIDDDNEGVEIDGGIGMEGTTIDFKPHLPPNS